MEPYTNFQIPETETKHERKHRVRNVFHRKKHEEAAPVTKVTQTTSVTPQPIPASNPPAVKVIKPAATVKPASSKPSAVAVVNKPVAASSFNNNKPVANTKPQNDFSSTTSSEDRREIEHRRQLEERFNSTRRMNLEHLNNRQQDRSLIDFDEVPSSLPRALDPAPLPHYDNSAFYPASVPQQRQEHNYATHQQYNYSHEYNAPQQHALPSNLFEVQQAPYQQFNAPTPVAPYTQPAPFLPQEHAQYNPFFSLPQALHYPVSPARKPFMPSSPAQQPFLPSSPALQQQFFPASPAHKPASDQTHFPAYNQPSYDPYAHVPPPPPTHQPYVPPPAVQHPYVPPQAQPSYNSYVAPQQQAAHSFSPTPNDSFYDPQISPEPLSMKFAPEQMRPKPNYNISFPISPSFERYKEQQAPAPVVATVPVVAPVIAEVPSSPIQMGEMKYTSSDITQALSSGKLFSTPVSSPSLLVANSFSPKITAISTSSFSAPISKDLLPASPKEKSLAPASILITSVNSPVLDHKVTGHDVLSSSFVIPTQIPLASSSSSTSAPYSPGLSHVAEALSLSEQNGSPKRRRKGAKKPRTPFNSQDVMAHLGGSANVPFTPQCSVEMSSSPSNNINSNNNNAQNTSNKAKNKRAKVPPTPRNSQDWGQGRSQDASTSILSPLSRKYPQSPVKSHSPKPSPLRGSSTSQADLTSSSTSSSLLPPLSAYTNGAGRSNKRKFNKFPATQTPANSAEITPAEAAGDIYAPNINRIQEEIESAVSHARFNASGSTPSSSGFSTPTGLSSPIVFSPVARSPISSPAPVIVIDPPVDVQDHTEEKELDSECIPVTVEPDHLGASVPVKIFDEPTPEENTVIAQVPIVIVPKPERAAAVPKPLKETLSEEQRMAAAASIPPPPPALPATDFSIPAPPPPPPAFVPSSEKKVHIQAVDAQGNRSNLFADIRKGHSLKHADSSSHPAEVELSKSNVFSHSIANAICSRRAAISDDEEDEETELGGSWE
eukprot:TRINITY_DN1019_c0_g1_i2.p1 TRINITY_DN1019_c0_g1~~TRINITY_DN1019_c0_g1_i2.p1  ORF type:complete len:1001 (-),score=334.68 TRINITY_DN1019_c0_g1_i2:80-3082(-)